MPQEHVRDVSLKPGDGVHTSARLMGSLLSLRVWLRQRGRYWLPPVLWMAVMFGLSTDVFAAEHTGKVLWYVVSAVAPRVKSSCPK